MSRYIDADALIRKIQEGHKFGSLTITELISECPTADVVEVMHGKNISNGGFLCSVCKFGDFNGFHGYEPNFCPNCGADMRLKGGT